MIEAEPDQFLGDRKRDKSLRRLPRYIEFFGDLVLEYCRQWSRAKLPVWLD